MIINSNLMPIKAHYFFFMAAMGPILPQLSVFGKQLGISTVVMGTVTGILPILFLLAKPLFGLIVDKYRDYRKMIFITLVVCTGVFYAGLYFVPSNVDVIKRNTFYCETDFTQCNVTLQDEKYKCETLSCTISCDAMNETILAISKPNGRICFGSTLNGSCDTNCSLECVGVKEDTQCTMISMQFWVFIVLMCAGTIGFNVINSISDAICFDVLGEGEQMSYGNQRVWGTVGFGLTALLSGYAVDCWSVGDVKSFTPALVIMVIFLSIDVFCCRKLKLPQMETPKNIINDICNLLKHQHIRIFVVFAALAGIVDSFIVYFFFWYVTSLDTGKPTIKRMFDRYLEELAASTGHLHRIKLLEGVIVAAETLGGEVLFFSVSGAILKAIGYGHSLSLCFVNYALRLALISMVTNPWWVIPIELCLQGPTYAMCYTTIVAYASAISPPGTSATMQGLVAGIDDGFGYAIGSVLGGILFRLLGGRAALQCFSATALLCGIVHFILYRTILKDAIPKVTDDGCATIGYHSTTLHPGCASIDEPATKQM